MNTTEIISNLKTFLPEWSENASTSSDWQFSIINSPDQLKLDSDLRIQAGLKVPDYRKIYPSNINEKLDKFLVKYKEDLQENWASGDFQSLPKTFNNIIKLSDLAQFLNQFNTKIYYVASFLDLQASLQIIVNNVCASLLINCLLLCQNKLVEK